MGTVTRLSSSTAPGSRNADGGHRGPRWRWWILLFLVALGTRAGWGLSSFTRSADASALEFPDEQQYWHMARSFVADDGLRDELGFQSTRMPLYPVFLSLFVGTGGVIGAKVTQWILGAVLAVLTAGVATHLLDRRIGLLAGLLVALDPFLVSFCSLLLTETAYTVALVALWWIVAPMMESGHGSVGRWTATGLVAALGVYVRESSVGLVLLVLGFLLLGRRFERRVLSGAALGISLIVLALLPWAVRNHHRTGTWCWLTTRAGISLYDGVGPTATGGSDLGTIKQMPAVRDLSEAEWNRFFLHEAFTAIRANPQRIIKLAGVKLARMWNPFPNVATYQSRLARTVSAGWMIPTMALAIMGAVVLPITRKGKGWRIVFFLLLPAIYFSAVHSVFVGSVRYRLPATPFLEILAAAAVVAMVDRFRHRPKIQQHGGTTDS